MKVKFDCPTCGKNDLIEVRNNIQTESIVQDMGEITDGIIDMNTDMIDMDIGDIVCYMCGNCEDRIKDDEDNAIIEPQQLFEWLKDHGMLE